MMNKIKKMVLPFVPISFLVSMLPSVNAQSAGGIGDLNNIADMIIKLFSPIFGADFLAGDNFIFWSKFLIWILLFAVLYFVTRMVFKDNKNIAVTIAALVAALGTLGMPESILRGIIESYTLIASFLLYIAPIAGMLILIYKVLHKEDTDPLARAFYAIKAVLFFLLAGILTNFLDAMKKAGTPSFNVTQQIAAFAISVCILLAIYYIIRALFAGPASAAPTMPDWMRNLGGAGAPAIPPAVPPMTPPPDFHAMLDQLESYITDYINFRNGPVYQAMRDLLNLNATSTYYTAALAAAWTAYLAALRDLTTRDTRIRTHINAIVGTPRYNQMTMRDRTRMDNEVLRFVDAINQLSAITAHAFNLYNHGRGPDF